MSKKKTIAALVSDSLVLGSISGLYATEGRIGYRVLGSGDAIRAQVHEQNTCKVRANAEIS